MPTNLPTPDPRVPIQLWALLWLRFRLLVVRTLARVLRRPKALAEGELENVTER